MVAINWTRWLSTPGPTSALEVAADRVSAVTVDAGPRAAKIVAHATEALPPDALQPAVSRANLSDRAAVLRAVTAVLERLPARPGRVGLVVPDSAAKVSLVRFETEPKRDADLDSMIRWQVRKAVPFKLEDAQVSYTSGGRLADGGREHVVAIMRRDIVQEYEQLCVDTGVQPGIVDLAGFSVINAGLQTTPAGTEDDWLFVHAAEGYHSIGIVRHGHLTFFRNRVGSGEAELSDLVHQTAMYYEDRLGGGRFERVLLAGCSRRDDVARVVEVLGSRLGTAVETVNPGVEMPRGTDGAAAMQQLAAPIGLLLRRRRVAA